MSKGRRPTKRSKYYVPAEIWDHAISFLRCYPVWVKEARIYDTASAIRYDLPKVQTSGDYNPVEQTAMKHAKLRDKIEMVEDAAAYATGNKVLQQFLIKGATQGLSYETMRKQGIPCGPRQYYRMRRKMICFIAKIL